LGILAAIVISTVPGLERLIVTQSMRVLHLVYIVFFLFLGGWLGQIWLREHPIRWAAVIVPLCAVMFYVQLRTFEGSGHFDWPGAAPRNPWVQGFAWARENTPLDAKFVLPFDHMRLPGEDFYGFRAWAERSRTVDDVKDRAVAALTPSLANAWRKSPRLPLRPEAEDLQMLGTQHNFMWVLLQRPGVPGLSCPYANDVVVVCRIPAPVNPPDNSTP
jgi:hypothetical protein